MPRSKSDYRRWKPEYKSPTEAGMAVTAVPPFSFHGVTARVFPLRANISSLNSLCDSYLNMDIPRSIVHFKPLIPYVYLIVLDYGDMSVDVGTRFWVSQREVSFALPLERYKEDENGELVFQDFALVHPFIYVDDDWSLLTGREVYGWPKVFAKLNADVNLWTRDPRSRTRLLNLSTDVFPRDYANAQMVHRTLLEVYSDPEATFTQVPLVPSSPFNAISALQDAISGSLRLATDLADMVFRSNIRGYEPTHSLRVLQEMFGYSLGLAEGILPEALLAQLKSSGGGEKEPGDSTARPKMMVNNVNLKQFRDAEDPSIPCYQELNYSVMGVHRLNRAGMLGDMKLLRGDVSGGYRVAVHRYASQPIVETLGLVVEETWDKDDESAAILKPILPFWCDVEFHYGRGRPLCWRTAENSAKKANYWKENRRGDTPVCDQPDAARTTLEADAGRRPEFDTEGWADTQSALHQAQDVLFNATRGASLQAVAGPFEYPDVTARVFPLLADRSRLLDLCQRYLNSELESAGIRFEPFGSYVYLVVTNFGTQQGAMWSETNNIGAWKERQVSFQVPIKWYMKDGGKWKLRSVAMLSPFSFANTPTNVASNREITGNRTEQAKIECPPGTWMDESGPVAENTLLTLSTELLPALGLGQKTVDRTLLEVVAKDVLPYNDDVGWRFVSEDWGSRLVTELKRKAALGDALKDHYLDLKVLAARLLASGGSLNEIVLRQCRDSADPLHASFQALLLVQSTITKVYDIREIEEQVHVAIHAYPSHPIVEALGLQTKRVSTTGDSVVQYLQPIRPFWMRLAMKEALAKNICRRESALWEVPHLEALGPTAHPTAAKAFCSQMRKELGEIKMHPQRLRERLEEKTEQPLGALHGVMEQALAPAHGDEGMEPQVVIESILSEEWENWGNPRWYQRKQEQELLKEKGQPVEDAYVRQKPHFCIPENTIASREKALFIERERLEAIEGVPGWLQLKQKDVSEAT